MTFRRVGLLGGAFNPPHLGHLKLAELAVRELGLDEIRFVPSAQPPHKSLPPESPTVSRRLRLLQEALEGFAAPFAIETLELDRPGPGYTVDTLETLIQREPDPNWIWLIGSDQLAQFTSWKRWERVLELASLAVAPRPDAPNHIPAALEARQRPEWSGAPGELIWLSSTNLALSSSKLRAELAQGGIIEGLPIQVRAAIGRENLYR
ncbi:MAG: nicotinate (nicotinamide) nucleotide adenylyltransferase [Holophaga sp.]|nr:nicotinate (nicotinamide) nucleotide adenylyltransferase [Holophaga sp.]